MENQENNNQNHIRRSDLFLINTVHEIRTPVQTIIGTLELLSDTKLNREQKDYLHQLKFSSEVLLTLVNDILDFEKIHSDQFSLETIPYNPVELTEDTTYLESIDAYRKKIELITDLDYSLNRQFYGDPTRIKQVLLNIIKNALKFTEKGYVKITLRKENCNLVYRIIDSGIGISVEDRDKVFKNFWQGDASVTRKFGGTGLGLAICKVLVENMNGSIDVSANPEGGSIFTIKLPAKPVDNSVCETFPAPKNPDINILIVDSNLKVIENLKSKLEYLGYKNIEFATDSGDSLKILNKAAELQNPFKLVFLNILMPHFDGWHLASEIKNSPVLKKMQIVMLVNEGQMESSSRIKLLNWFNGYIYKPVRLRRLSQELSEIEVSNRSSMLKELLNEPTEATIAATEKATIAMEMKILVAEDHPVNRRLLVTFLKQFGANVLEACNGQEALDIAKKNKDIKIIFMDIQMPVLSGLDAAIKLREMNRKEIIVACTANNDKETFDLYIEKGINDILPKPFKREDVEAMLKKWKSVVYLPDTTYEPETIEPEQENNLIWDTKDFEDTIGHDKDLGCQILFDYEDQTNQLIEDAKNNLKDPDYTLLRRIGHTLHGSSAAISAGKLAEAGKELNLEAKAQDLEKISNKLQDFEILFAKFLKEIDHWKNSMI